MGGFQLLYPGPDVEQQVAYEGLLRIAIAVFQRNSVWSKAQSSLQELQVGTLHGMTFLARYGCWSIEFETSPLECAWQIRMLSVV